MFEDLPSELRARVGVEVVHSLADAPSDGVLDSADGLLEVEGLRVEIAEDRAVIDEGLQVAPLLCSQRRSGRRRRALPCETRSRGERPRSGERWRTRESRPDSPLLCSSSPSQMTADVDQQQPITAATNDDSHRGMADVGR